MYSSREKGATDPGYINWVFCYINKQTVLVLYRALVSSLLEYGAHFWFPTKLVDKERLEKVQNRATKLVPSICHKGYQISPLVTDMRRKCYRPLKLITLLYFRPM